MMASSFLQLIDWSRPWLASLRATGVAIAQAADWRAELNARASAMALRNHRGLPIRFVPQADLPSDIAYETFISNTGGVPTRENLHDFFNALAWLHFPKIKTQLNALQARQIETSAGMNSLAPRGKLRDAATIFDENAVLFVTSNADLVRALRSHEWKEVFVTRRANFINECCVFLFGHALMEKLVMPYKAITGHAWIVTLALPAIEFSVAEQCKRIDAVVAKQLANGLSTTDFSPLPLLGVPGWWANQDDAFYADVSVFRPKRVERKT